MFPETETLRTVTPDPRISRLLTLTSCRFCPAERTVTPLFARLPLAPVVDREGLVTQLVDPAGCPVTGGTAVGVADEGTGRGVAVTLGAGLVVGEGVTLDAGLVVGVAVACRVGAAVGIGLGEAVTEGMGLGATYMPPLAA
jgi:hypothetical protein